MHPRPLLAGLVLAWTCASLCPAADTYHKQATWLDTLLHSREAQRAAKAEAKTPVPLPDFGTGKFTFAAWIRTGRDGSIAAKMVKEGGWRQGGKALFLRGRVLNYDIGWVGCVKGRVRVADGKWHHVALTGGRPQAIYVDGRLDARGNLEERADPKRAVLKIGHTSTSFPHGGFGFAGEIDDVRVYARVLSEKQIKALVAERPPTSGRGLVACWPFDGDALDASGCLNHATPSGKTLFAEGRFAKALKLANAAHMVVSCGAGNTPARALWARLEADFADAASREQMAWEREDGIWGGDVLRVSLAEAARRYAAATQRPTALAGEAKALAETTRTADDLKKLRALYLRGRRFSELLGTIAAFDLEGLRATVHDLHADGAKAKPLLARLDAIEAEAADWAGSGDVPPEKLEAWKKRVASLRQDVLVRSNPLFDFDELVFVKRFTYTANHYYTEFINSRWLPGGNLCVLSLKDGSVREVVPSLKGGVFGRFDVSFDAKRIAFAWKPAAQEGYRLYEVNVDGTGLRQLTFPQENEAWLVKMYRARPHYHHGTDDMDPCYLPDGGIAFISTRCQYGILCDGPDDFTTTVVYRMDADGKNMRRLTNSSVSEACPTMLPDGRVLYTRWEYLDKGAVSVKCLWAMAPDGTGSSEVYANDISLPPTFLYGRAIPNAPSHYVVLGTPHYPQNGMGTVIRLNMGGGNIRTRDPMTYMTPYVDIRGEGGFAFRKGEGAWRNDRSGRGPLFKDPYPLSTRYFLVAHKPEGPAWTDPTGYGIYLLDETGRVSLVYRDPEISCFHPYPLKPRSRPPVLRSTPDPELAGRNLARCIVADVYHGLADVERGSIKHIRIIEQIPRPWATRRRWSGDTYDQQHACVTKDTHLGLKVQHGIVPVEPDGSAHFLVPANANVSFQALDANYMALQTERTYVNYMPGETRGCVGCHETLEDAPAPFQRGALQALARAASLPGPQPGEEAGARTLDYIADVQPVLDRHCVKCHSGTEPKAGLNLSGKLTDLFCVSYESLVPERRRRPRGDRGLLGPVIGENHPKTGNVHYLPARSLGSHASILVAMLSKGKVKLRDPKAAKRAAQLAEKHKAIELKPEELLRITNFVDTNSQYYGAYWGRRHLRYKDHPNFRPTHSFAAAISTKPPLPEEKR